MNLHTLRLFHEVAKWGSVTKAAEKLLISQPSVTSQIKKLEKEEGVQLLVPDGRGIKLTEIGEGVYRLSQELFQVERQITHYLNEEKMAQSVLKVGGNYLTVNHLIGPWLKNFRREFPNYQVTLATLNSTDLLQGLRVGELDVIIMGASGEKDKEFVSYPVYTDRLCFVANPTFFKGLKEKISVEDLFKCQFIGREGTSFNQQELEKLALKQCQGLPEFRLTYNNSWEALQAVLAGEGVHYCSYLLVKELIDRGKLVEIPLEIVATAHPLRVYCRKDVSNSLIIQAFHQIIKK